MQDRSRTPKRPRDLNQLAARLVAESTGQVPPAEPVDPIKAAAATLGRRGGLKGGKARAAALSAEDRSRIARQAAATRWKKPV